MLDQNLLDKQMILGFIIDLLEKSKLFDKNLKQILTIGIFCYFNYEYIYLLNLLFNLVVQNINHYLQSELLSRRLAYYCCKKLSSLFNDQITDTKVTNSKSALNCPPPTPPSQLQEPLVNKNEEKKSKKKSLNIQV
jgi:mediator of RNA polymerase II transcription subunit 12